MGGIDTEADSFAALGLYNIDSPWLSEFVMGDEGKRLLEVWPENLEVINMFLSLQTQWRSDMNGLTGLDYAGVECALRMHEVSNPKQMFIEIQSMEGAALKELNHG
ncbi:MAG: DUF1799 domain-containing protein [Methylophilaceae bacterium]|nr:DUF1799 domain-containing protein [Methyloradius sp.]